MRDMTMSQWLPCPHLADVVAKARALHSPKSAPPVYPALKRITAERFMGGEHAPEGRDLGLAMLIHDPYQGEDRGGYHAE